MNKISLLFLAACAALAACGTGCASARAKLSGQMKLVERDARDNLLERMDKLFGNRESPPDLAEPAEPVVLPYLEWKFGDFKPAAPVALWRGVMSATRTHVSLDYTGCPAWFEAMDNDNLMCEVAVFYEDGGRLIGGKFDWINFPRSARELTHTLDYKGWDGRYADRVPACVIIVNTQNREWMFFSGL